MKAIQTNNSISVQIPGSGRSNPSGAPSAFHRLEFAHLEVSMMIYEIAVNGLLAAYCQGEADEKLIRAACGAILQAGVLSGIHQGLSTAKEAFAAEGEANHGKEAIR